MAQPTDGWSDFTVRPSRSICDGPDNRQWFINSYIPKQTIPILRSFADVIQAQTGRYLGVRNGELKASVVQKWVSLRQILMPRVQTGFNNMKDAGQLETYRTTRQMCEQRGHAVAAYRYPTAPAQPVPTFGGGAGYGELMKDVADRRETSSICGRPILERMESYRLYRDRLLASSTHPGGLES
jgi:hypothetical protein